jgi:cytochrome c-type biogenesis protein CcmE
MLPHTKLALGAVVLAGAAAYLAYLGAATSWRYYVLVDECASGRSELVGQRLRVSGRVAAGSLALEVDRSRATFRLCGQQTEVPVTCRGPIPDNLKEEMEVVVEGTLESSGTLRGDKLMTRCASKYEATAGREAVTQRR